MLPQEKRVNKAVSILFYLFIFWLHHVACGILVPQPGMEPVPPVVGGWSFNHWIFREVPHQHFKS